MFSSGYIRKFFFSVISLLNSFQSQYSIFRSKGGESQCTVGGSGGAAGVPGGFCPDTVWSILPLGGNHHQYCCC